MKILLLICVVQKVLAIQNNSPIVKECPQVKLMQANISINLITGTWFEVSKHSSSFTPGSCISVNFTLISNVTASFTYSQRFDGDGKRNISTSRINATIIRSNFWSCSFKSLYVALDGYIYILDTDYYNYAVVLGCGSYGRKGLNMSTRNGHMVWVLSRNPQLESSFMTRINETLRQNNLSLALRATVQNDCNNTAFAVATTEVTATEDIK